MQIDIYSDVVCPWCFVGITRLNNVLAARRDAAAGTAVVHHPFVLHPDAPPEGLDLRQMLKAKYGGDPQQMFARVEAAGRMEGLALDFSRVSRTYMTAAAHTLIRHAHARHTQRALVDALFRSYFLDGESIGDVGVLARIAAAHGFSHEEAERLATDARELEHTWNEAQATRRLGVTGVPVFIIDGRHAISGAQPADVFHRTLDRAAGEAAEAR